jgi:hypothetical protein
MQIKRCSLLAFWCRLQWVQCFRIGLLMPWLRL